MNVIFPQLRAQFTYHRDLQILKKFSLGLPLFLSHTTLFFQLRRVRVEDRVSDVQTLLPFDVTILFTADKWSPTITLTGILATLLKASTDHSAVNSSIVRLITYFMGNSWNLYFM